MKKDTIRRKCQKEIRSYIKKLIEAKRNGHLYSIELYSTMMIGYLNALLTAEIISCKAHERYAQINNDITFSEKERKIK